MVLLLLQGGGHSCPSNVRGGQGKEGNKRMDRKKKVPSPWAEGLFSIGPDVSLEHLAAHGDSPEKRKKGPVGLVGEQTATAHSDGVQE